MEIKNIDKKRLTIFVVIGAITGFAVSQGHTSQISKLGNKAIIKRVIIGAILVPIAAQLLFKALDVKKLEPIK